MEEYENNRRLKVGDTLGPGNSYKMYEKIFKENKRREKEAHDKAYRAAPKLISKIKCKKTDNYEYWEANTGSSYEIVLNQAFNFKKWPYQVETSYPWKELIGTTREETNFHTSGYTGTLHSDGSVELREQIDTSTSTYVDIKSEENRIHKFKVSYVFTNKSFNFNSTVKFLYDTKNVYEQAKRGIQPKNLDSSIFDKLKLPIAIFVLFEIALIVNHGALSVPFSGFFSPFSIGALEPYWWITAIVFGLTFFLSLLIFIWVKVIEHKHPIVKTIGPVSFFSFPFLSFILAFIPGIALNILTYGYDFDWAKIPYIVFVVLMIACGAINLIGFFPTYDKLFFKMMDEEYNIINFKDRGGVEGYERTLEKLRNNCFFPDEKL